jgi:RNA polymerase sigma factor (sigma-70 family)
MMEISQDEAIGALMRRVFAQEVADSGFDVESGLRDVLDRVTAGRLALVPRTEKVPVTVGAASRPTEAPAPRPWAGLDGAARHAACMLAARDGDREAFDTLVADLTPLVWHVARGNGLDPTTAEDVVQTVWLALLRQLDRLTEPRALAGWLITTTRREAKRVQQSSSTMATLTPEVAERTQATSPAADHELLRTERDRELWSAFHRLSLRCQELLRLTVMAGRAEYRAVAEAMHMPRGSVGPTRGRCLNDLRSLYQGEVGS